MIGLDSLTVSSPSTYAGVRSWSGGRWRYRHIGMNERSRSEPATVLAAEGIYPVRVRASGLTFSGVPFSREQTLTAAVFADGDQFLTTTPPEQPSPLYCIIEGLTEA